MPKQFRSPKGGKGPSRPVDYEDFKEKKNRQLKQDSTWYIKDAQLRKDLGRFPFSVVGGLNIKEEFVNVPQSTVCAIEWDPAMPNEKSGANGATLAARMLYTYVRHQNSGHTNYDAPDLFLYVYGYVWLLAFVEHLHRLYRIINTYVLCNKAVPNHLLAAYGLGTTNANLLRSKISSFRGRLNMALYRLSSFAIPRGFTLIDRWMFLNSQIFKDGDDEQAQMYMYVPAHLWQVYDNWLAGSGNTWTGTAFAPYESAGLDVIISNSGLSDPVEAIFSEVDLLIDVFASSEDFNIMCGDMLKAFGEENIIKLKSVSDDEVITFSRDEMALNQLKHGVYDNKVQIGPMVQDTEGVIFQLMKVAGTSLSGSTINWANVPNGLNVNGNAFTFNADTDRGLWLTDGCPSTVQKYGLVTASITSLAGLSKLAFNFKDVPTDEAAVIDATRNMRITEYRYVTGSGANYLAPTNIYTGSEVFSQVIIFASDQTYAATYNRAAHISQPNNVNLITGINIPRVSDFAWFPLLYLYSWTSGASSVEITEIITDKNKIQLVHGDYLRNVHAQSFMGLFTVPVVAKYTGLE